MTVAHPTTLPCSKCGKEKAIESFRRRLSRPETGKRKGRWSWCLDCEKAALKTPRAKEQLAKRRLNFLDKMRRENPKELRRRERRQNLVSKYGITLEEYEKMLAAQSGRCAICNQTPTNGRGKKLHVDHDHQTGKIRGLLCNQCNSALGNFKDDPQILLSAIAYLKTYL